jgi:hypothetical protein
MPARLSMAKSPTYNKQLVSGEHGVPLYSHFKKEQKNIKKA